MLRLAHLTLRRTTAAIAVTGAAVLIPAIALASPGRPAAADGRATAAHGRVAATRCHTGALTDWIGLPGDRTAGSTYYMLEISNTSRTTCSLFGFPGVSAIGTHGNQLGSSANWERTSSPHTVILAPGATAHTMLAYHDAAVTTEAGCDPVNSATLLKVYPPGQHKWTYAAYDFQSCSRPGVRYLSIVGPIIPGVGTING